MKRTGTRAAIFVTLLGMLSGCMAGGDIDTSRTSLGADYVAIECGPGEVPIKKNGATVGTLALSNDYDSFDATITADYPIAAIHMYVGPFPGPIVLGEGFDFDAFPVQDSFAPGVYSKSYSFDYDAIARACGDDIKIVLRITFENGSEAFAWGTSDTYGANNNPYFYYQSCDCEPPPPPPSDGCTLTQGYWKNHPDAWPVDSLTLGGVSYTKAQLLTLLKTPPKKGDASMIVAHQLIAAKLNVASGAAASADIAAADAWLAANQDADGRLPFGVKSSAGTAIGDALAGYNEGLTGPGHCDD